MTSKKIILLTICFLGSIAIVVALYQVSNKVNHAPNGFVRLFRPNSLKPRPLMDLHYNSWYIAGVKGDSFYLGNYTVPIRLLAIDKELKGKTYKTLILPKPYPIFKDQALTYVYGNDIYLMEGMSPYIYAGHLSDSVISLSARKNHFLSAVPLSPGSNILRMYDPTLKKCVLAKSFADSLKVNPQILVRQVDGLFCTDGLLNYEPLSNNLVYVYFYRNEFIRMDTNLNIVLRGKTIDTVSTAQLKVSAVQPDSLMMMSSPALMVNHHSCIDGQNLYIHSDLKANNEDLKTFKQYSVIDVYSLQTNVYKFSFYLQNYQNEKLTSLKVFGKTLLAVHGRYLLSYTINFD